MGYTTGFEGGFTVTPPLTDAEAEDLSAFANEDHRDTDDPWKGQDGMPGIWCQWVPVQSGWRTESQRDENYAPSWDTIEWDGGEKFYDYVEWIQWLIDNKLAPTGHVLNGSVAWQGEESDDMGRIVITDNVVKTQHAEVSYADD